MATRNHVQKAYKADITLQLIKQDGTLINIPKLYVKYILLNYQYEKYHMPVIYLSLAVTDSLYTDLIDNDKSATINLTIYKYNVESTNSLKQLYLQGKFTYIPSTNNPNYTKDISKQSNSKDTSYKGITLALLDMNLLNQSKTSFNGIYSKIDENTLILKALKGLDKCVVKQPLYNPTFDTIIIPPITSKNNLLKFIFQQNPFYDTNYEFFMDFKRSYLLDWSGGYVDANDGEPGTIIISIQSVSSKYAYYEGLQQDDNSYKLYINPANTNIDINHTTDNTTNQMIFVDENGEIEYVDLNVNNSKGSAVKRTFYRGGNAVLYKNISESSAIGLEVMKENIDGDIFTPNKKIQVTNYKSYNKYDGEYVMSFKNQLIQNIEGEFRFVLLLGLKKVSDIEKLGTKQEVKAVYNSQDAVARYKNSTRTKNIYSYRTSASRKTSKAKSEEAIRSSGVVKLSAGMKCDGSEYVSASLKLNAPSRILPKVKHMEGKDDEISAIKTFIKQPENPAQRKS